MINYIKILFVIIEPVDQSFVTISSRPVDDHSYYRILFWLMERDPELKSQISGDELTAEN